MRSPINAYSIRSWPVSSLCSKFKTPSITDSNRSRISQMTRIIRPSHRILGPLRNPGFQMLVLTCSPQLGEFASNLGELCIDRGSDSAHASDCAQRDQQADQGVFN